MASSKPSSSELRFASLATYCPRGGDREHERSRTVMRQLKENQVVGTSHGSMTMAEFVARRLVEVGPDFVTTFLASDVTLVPIPRSSLQRPGALWPAKELADALHRHGFGASVLACLRRVRQVPKAATSRPSERPRATQHLASLEVMGGVDLPPVITLVDDVITRGAQVMGAAWALWKVRPDLDIRAFAALRTISDEADFVRTLVPTVGLVSLRGDETFRSP